MNKEQVTGRIKEAAGEVQEHVGRATGNKSQEAKGAAREAQGKVEKNVGDTANKVENIVTDVKRDLKK